MEEVVQSYHHGDLRRALIDAASKQLVQLGPDKLSLRALARDVGVSQTAPYRHFSDKTALLAALAAVGFELLYEQSHAAAQTEVDARRRLLVAGRAYIAFALENPELYRLMFGPMIPQDYDCQELKEAGNRALQVILDISIDGIQHGEFVVTDPLAIANSTWALVHGLSSLLIDNRYACVEGGVPEDHVEQSLSVIFTGIGSAAPFRT